MNKAAIFHFWTILILVDCFCMNLWYNTDLVVEGQKTPWLTFGPLYTLTVGATALFYFTNLAVEEEDHFWKRYVYISLNFMLFFGMVGLAIDGGLYLSDREQYCQLQKMPVMKECEERNKLLKPLALVFYIIGVPIIWQCN